MLESPPLLFLCNVEYRRSFFSRSKHQDAVIGSWISKQFSQQNICKPWSSCFFPVAAADWRRERRKESQGEQSGGGGGRETNMQRGLRAVRRAVGRATVLCPDAGGAVGVGHQALLVVADTTAVICEQAEVATSSRLRRCFSALPRTSPMTIQSINPKVFFSFCVAFKVLDCLLRQLDMKPDRNRIYHIGCHASAPDFIGIRSVSPPLCLLACSLDVLLPIWVRILSLQLSAL